jgi:2-polyprenyl-3-methyl-5-hydroxy-6-metoxy-1,4-benzoquinol methylase
VTFQYDFNAQRAAWSRPPVDDVDYISSTSMLEYDDSRLRELVDRMTHTRFSTSEWRNFDNRWVSTLRFDSTRNAQVLDFGCGVGVEALRYALAGNSVSIADIVEDSVRLATRVLGLYDQRPEATYVVGCEPPFVLRPDESIDVFHCSGVLHHIPYARAVVEDAHRLLRESGELRLMVYSDVGWRNVTDGSEPPDDVTAHPRFRDFVSNFDQVGTYADWYDRAKIERLFGDLFAVEVVRYLTPWDNYLAAVLRKR